MNGERAETLALRALAFLAAQTNRLEGFCRVTGVAPADLPAMATDRSALAAILDYLLGDEALMLAFAQDEGLAPDDPAAARRAMGPLPMGDDTA